MLLGLDHGEEMRKGGGAGRPVGTDGFDFAYRMTVDDRYKRAAQGRMQLRKFVTIQAAFIILKALWASLMSLKGEPAESTTVTACAFGGAAVFVGTLGLKRSRSYLLKFYLLLTVVSLSLSFLPIVSGHFFTQWSKDWEFQKQNSNYSKFVLTSLEGLQEIAGILVQVLAASTALSLSKNLS